MLFLIFFFIFRQLIGHDTGSADYVKEYRPLFMDHFDKKETENNLRVSLSMMVMVNNLKIIVNTDSYLYAQDMKQLPTNLVYKHQPPLVTMSPSVSVVPTASMSVVPPVQQSVLVSPLYD